MTPDKTSTIRSLGPNGSGLVAAVTVMELFVLYSEMLTDEMGEVGIDQSDE